MITAKTKITGLLGYPVEHSLSPAMHNAGFRHLKLDMSYLCFPVDPDSLPDAVNGIKAMNFIGVNVTIPHKEKVVPLLDEVNEEARFIGAVNTIHNKDGLLIGYNTDGKGFMTSLKESEIDTRNKEIFIIGAGGVSRAVCYYLGKKAKKLRIFDIDREKLNKLVSDLKNAQFNVYVEDNTAKIRDSDIIINATPLGMKESDPLPLDISLLKNDHIICDLIYWDTPLIKEARRKKCKTSNGLGMLFWQGLLAFEIWTGLKAPIEIMRKALIEGMAKQRENRGK